MTQYWTDLVKRLSPYVPGEQRGGDDVVKLNTNENPYPPSPMVMDSIASVSADALRKYSDPSSLKLRQSLAHYHAVSSDQVFVGNGSDEVLALAFMAFFQRAEPLQFPGISYSFYPVYCDLLNITQQTIELNEDFSIPLEQFGGSCGGIIFPNPNAPTAIAIDKPRIETLLKNNPNTVILVDEAYADFGAESCIDLIDTYPNLVVTRTFSKGRSLAGLRLGAAFGDANLIDGLLRVKDSFNSYPVDAIAQAAGVASLQDETYYRETVNKIIDTRKRLINELESRDFTVLPSAANFVFARPENHNAEQIFTALDDQNILVRYWNKPTLNNWLRITVGTDPETDRLLAALDNLAW